MVDHIVDHTQSLATTSGDVHGATLVRAEGINGTLLVRAEGKHAVVVNRDIIHIKKAPMKGAWESSGKWHTDRFRLPFDLGNPVELKWQVIDCHFRQCDTHVKDLE